jgi:hypothetical protein
MDDYNQKFEEAEKAVSTIKDEKLRAIAFERLINHILSGGSNQANGKTAKVTKKATEGSGVTKKKSEGPKAWLLELVEESFFQSPKSSNDIREELESRGHHLNATDLTFPLQKLCHEKNLRRKKIDRDGKQVLHWVNW